MTATMPWPTLLECPHCSSALRLVDDAWECDSHGTVALQRQGIADFLFDTCEIRLANEGRWDLEEDQQTGLKLTEVCDNYSYSTQVIHVD